MAATSKLVVVVGTTASGKSAAAMQMAQLYGGEIICADSLTIYKGMDIGTAKPSKEDRAAVPHHLLDIIEPDQKFSVAQFQKLATTAITDIQNRGKVPIVVGGTGLYVDALIYNYDFAKAEPSKQKLRPNTLVLGFRLPDDELKARIAARVEQMFAQGLEQEVQKLSKRYGWQADGMKGIGYREWQLYFAKQQDLATTKELIIKNTWQYARRQRTWFRRSQDIHWYSPSEQPSGTMGE
jgi:tRNA dimethylallyltransferase